MQKEPNPDIECIQKIILLRGPIVLILKSFSFMRCIQNFLINEIWGFFHLKPQSQQCKGILSIILRYNFSWKVIFEDAPV